MPRLRRFCPIVTVSSSFIGFFHIMARKCLYILPIVFIGLFPYNGIKYGIGNRHIMRLAVKTIINFNLEDLTMKLRKIMAGIIAGTLATAAMVTMASAAEFKLPIPAPWKGGVPDNQWGWGSDGWTDGEAVAGLTQDNLASAKGIALTFKNDLTAGSAQIVWQGQDDNYAWNQSEDIAFADAYDPATKTLTIYFSSSMPKYEAFTDDTKTKILVALFAGEDGKVGFEAAGIESIKLIGTKEGNPAGGATATTGGDGKEADTGAEGVAVLFGVAIIATGAIVLSKKIK